MKATNKLCSKPGSLFNYFNMVANVDELELRDCLARIGWNIRQCDAIIGEGFESIEDLGEMLLKDVSNICATISKLAAKHGGVRIGYALVRKLKGIVWWIKDHHRRGQDADEAYWTLQVCKDSTDYMDMEDTRAEDSNTEIEPPGKLRDGDWVQWKLKLLSYLQNQFGTSRVPLNYVIRKDVPVGHQFANPAEARVHERPLNGLVYTKDNRKVFGVIPRIGIGFKVSIEAKMGGPQ